MRAIQLHVTAAGNEAMRHIAALFAEGFAGMGVPASVVVDGRVPAGPDEVHHLVVAPHEYFPLHFLRERPTIELAPALAHASVLTVEQPASQWFEIGWSFARQAAHVFDVSPAGVTEYARRGVFAVHAPLGFAPSLDVGPAAGGRLVDVLLFGHGSARRGAFVARHAGFFAARTCQVRLSDVRRPRREQTRGYVSGDARMRLMASARIVLSVHSTERPYFEQHRALLALAGGALLVSETSRFTAPLEPGRHFLMAPLDELPALCARMLDQPSALASIAAAGHDFVRSSWRIDEGCRRIAETLEESVGDDRRDAARREVRRRLDESRELVQAGDVPWTITRNAAWRADATPRVSVVITSFNYERYLQQSLTSALEARAPAGGHEVVVVDDASTDGSRALVERSMQAAGVPVTIVRKSLNTGLADSRNVGLQVARGARVFILDADNWIFPDCLAELDAALPEGDAAAYGLLASHDEATGDATGLLSAGDWDVERLLEGPYIDAMALFDRRVLADVGGYSTDLVDHGWFGWEDYDVWLKLALGGHRVHHVPRVVARYREHERSMIAHTNQHAAALADHFRRKFAALVDRHPGLERYFAVLPGDPGRRSPAERERDALHAQVARLERQLADVYASASWRISAPLRAIARLVRASGRE